MSVPVKQCIKSTKEKKSAKKKKKEKLLALILRNLLYVYTDFPHCVELASEAWLPCCSLLNTMLKMSCSFMCSISCSLLVDSKPQMQQQKSSMQYSIPAGGCPVPPFLTDTSSAFGAEGGDAFSFWLRTMYERSMEGSGPDFEGTTGDLLPGIEK